MARPKKYSYANFAGELNLLCETYKKLDPIEIITAFGETAAVLSPNSINILIESAFRKNVELIKNRCDTECGKKKPGRPRKKQ